MPAESTPEFQAFMSELRRPAKYARLSLSLVQRIGADEFARQPSTAQALKAARTRLHQLTGAYLPDHINYAHFLDIFSSIPAEDENAFRAAAQNMMRLHASTAERLPILDHFFRDCLAEIAPVNSVLDLACGLNPLAIPWMPLADHFTYSACDAVIPLVDFLNDFFKTRQINGQAVECDLSSTVPAQPAQLALLLKTLPLLDQIDPTLAPHLLASLPADHILVSYPLRSLGGKGKGMYQTYTQRFTNLAANLGRRFRTFEFRGEIAFLLSR